MSAIVCGKRSFFEDIDAASSSPGAASPPAYKKFRCSSSTSPVRFTYSTPIQMSLVDQLKALFPDLEIQILERALDESFNDLDLATKNLHEFCLRHANGMTVTSAEENSLGHANDMTGTSAEENATMERVVTQTDGDSIPLQEPQTQNNLPADGAEWVDLFVREMINATSIDDAKSRAATILESLEKSISSRARVEAAQSFHKENVMLKEQIEVVLRDNIILKRAVAIQHERQKENDEKNQEVQHLKQLLAQYQEQLRTLEANNYALTLRLQHAQMSNSIPRRFHPDVF